LGLEAKKAQSYIKGSLDKARAELYAGLESRLDSETLLRTNGFLQGFRLIESIIESDIINGEDAAKEIDEMRGR